MPKTKRRKFVVIEQTSKRCKVIIVVGVLLILLGVLLTGVLLAANSTEFGEVRAACYGGGAVSLGIIVWLIGSVSAWWNHS